VILSVKFNAFHGVCNDQRKIAAVG